MRDLLLMAIVAVSCLVALCNGRFGLYVYVWFALLRPDILAWAYGAHPYSLAIAVCTLIGCVQFVVEGVRSWFNNRFCALLLLLVVLYGISVITGGNTAWADYWLFVRVVLMAMLIPLVLRNVEHFRIMFIVIAASLGFLATKWGLGGLVNGGARFAQGYGGFMNDNNCVALAFVMVIPFCWCAIFVVKKRLNKMIFLGMTFCGIAGIVFTHSRGGALGLAAALGVLALCSRHKVLVFLVLLVCAAPGVYLVRASYLERMATLQDVEAEDSAKARLNVAIAAVKMALDHPIFGVGFGTENFRDMVGNYLHDEMGDRSVAHNTYLQVWADSGTLAMIVHVILLMSAIIWLWGATKRARRIKPGLEAYPLGLLASMVGFAVGSTFLSRVVFDFYYMLLMMTVAWQVIEPTLKAQAETQARVPQPIQVRDPRMALAYNRGASAFPAGLSH